MPDESTQFLLRTSHCPNPIGLPYPSGFALIHRVQALSHSHPTNQMAKSGSENHNNVECNRSLTGSAAEAYSSLLHLSDLPPIERCVWSVCWQPSPAVHNSQQGSSLVLASAGSDRTVKLWRQCPQSNTDNRSVVSSTHGCSSSIENDLLEEGKALSSEQQKQRLEKLPSSLLEHCTTITGDHSKTVRCVTFSPCGMLIATASFDASIIVYQLANGEFEELHRLEGHENEVKCCAFSPSGEFLATCSRDKTVWIWALDEETETCDVCSILQCHTADVKFVAWHPAQDLLVSGGYDGSIRFHRFDGEDWTTVQSIKDAHEDTVWAGSFSPGSIGANRSEDYLLATVGADRYLKIWGQPSKHLNRQQDPDRENDESSLEQCGWVNFAQVRVGEDRPNNRGPPPSRDINRWPLYAVAWGPGLSYSRSSASAANAPPVSSASEKKVDSSFGDKSSSKQIEQRDDDEEDKHYGPIAVGGGDHVVRLYIFNGWPSSSRGREAQTLWTIASLRLDAEINSLAWKFCHSWQPPISQLMIMIDNKKIVGEEQNTSASIGSVAVDRTDVLLLAAGCEDGYVHLLKVSSINNRY